MQFSTLWDPLPYSSPCTTTRSGAPLGGGASWGRQRSAVLLCLGGGGVLLCKYRCRSAIALTIALLGPWTGAPERKKKRHGALNSSIYPVLKNGKNKVNKAETK